MKRFHYWVLISLTTLIIFKSNDIHANYILEEDPVIGDLIHEYGYQGWRYLEHNINLDSAEYFIKEALRLQYSTPDYKIDDRVATNHVNLASLYREIYNNEEALNNLNKAEAILMKTDPDNLLFVNIYHNKGNLYKTRNDLYRTKEYYQYALDFVINHGSQNTIRFAHVFSNLVNLLFELREYEEARRYLSMVDIENLSVSPQIQLRLYLTQANSYSQLNEYDLALNYFNKARGIIIAQDNNDVSNLAMSYYTGLIDFYTSYGQYDLANREIDHANAFIESLRSSSTKNKVNYQSLIIYRIAIIQFQKGNYQKANIACNQGIALLNDFFQKLSLANSSAATINKNSSVLPLLQVLKSRILLTEFQSSNSIEDLRTSFDSYQLAVQTLNKIKLSMQNEESKVFATSQILEVYNEAIYVGKLLYDMTGDLDYLEKSFEIAESSKSFALFSEIKNMEAIEFSDLPPEVKSKENRFVGEIQYYEERLYEEQLSADPDEEKITFYKDKLFHLKDDYDDLRQEIEENNEKYYQLKYNPKFVTLEEVKEELPYREALIEYVLSDSILITYVIDRKGINAFSQQVPENFNEDCMEYYRILHEQNFSNGVHRTYRRYVELGRQFYQILIEPCLQYTDRRSLTIVPDGAITYLPFEGFLEQEADDQYINYMTLPYMIRNYSIGYSHSSTLKFSKRLKSKSTKNEVLAFAPKYKKPDDSLTLADLNRQADEGEEILFPLGGIIKEVQSINETVPSRVFLNEEATEANFKKYASDYNVLHLAMHTIMRDDEPLNSHLAFTNMDIQDTTEDERLYAYEIYNMKLNAQMAVLSSCSSGFGKMQKGEGMMSLARGFIYAGCPSIVMTLWRVSDQSSSALMTSFYKYLKKGKSKQESMRLAKLDYLENADDITSNPYFWSGFVVVGDGSPIYRKSGMAYWMVLITIFLGVMIYIQYRRR